MWVAGTNMCGYLCESEPVEFESFDDAKQYVIDEMKRDEDNEAEFGHESIAEELCAAAEDVNLEKDEFTYIINGRAYWVKFFEAYEKSE